MREYNEKKLAIIIRSENKQYLEECLLYIHNLNMPKEFDAELYVVDNEHIAEDYNDILKRSNAKYKIYIAETTFCVYKECVKELIALFEKYPKLGILGIAGKSDYAFTKNNLGKMVLSDSDLTMWISGQRGKKDFYTAVSLDGAMIATQYDIEWEKTVDENERMWKHCHSFTEFGYEVGIPYQDCAWCQVEKTTHYLFGEKEQKVDKNILKNIMEICKRESQQGIMSFAQKLKMGELVEKYNYYKFLVRRIDNGLPYEYVCDLYVDMNEGLLSKEAVEVLLGHEVLYPRRVRHSIEINEKGSKVGKTNGRLGERMNVLCSFNKKYVAPACVMLDSLYRNNRETNIYVYVFHNELQEEDKTLVKEHGEKYGAKVEFLWVDKKMFSRVPTNMQWTIEAYFRLAMTELLPDTLDRVLYLDVDTLVLKPIYDFYFSDFEGMDLFACKDMGSAIPFGDNRDNLYREHIGKEYFTYCCSGVTLWNIEKLRKRVSVDKYMQIAEEINFGVVAADQDLINLMHIKQINLVDEYQYGCFVGGWNWTREEVKRHVSILHYAGVKPWDVHHPKQEIYKLWWEYAKGTPLYVQMLEQILEEGYQ